MTAAIAEQCLAGNPVSEAIKAQLPLDVWDLGVFGYAGGAMTARFKDRADRAGRGATGITQRSARVDEGMGPEKRAAKGQL